MKRRIQRLVTAFGFALYVLSSTPQVALASPQDLFGYGPERMNDYRQQVLEVDAAAMREAAANRLVMDQIAVAVITSERSLDASGLNWAREQI